jgi:hypothetical protein
MPICDLSTPPVSWAVRGGDNGVPPIVPTRARKAVRQKPSYSSLSAVHVSDPWGLDDLSATSRAKKLALGKDSLRRLAREYGPKEGRPLSDALEY